MNSRQPIRLEELDAGHPLRRHPLEQAGVPDGYFDTLASRVQARVAKPQETGPLISWSWGRTVASLAGAGLVATLVWITWPQRQEGLGKESLSGVSDAAIVAYFDEQGLNPDEVQALQPNTAIISNDSTTIRYLDVQPDVIRQELDLQDLNEEFGSMGT